jgi:lipoprotein-anchoring transpeptidase ErfK/SrfK
MSKLDSFRFQGPGDPVPGGPKKKGGAGGPPRELPQPDMVKVSQDDLLLSDASLAQYITDEKTLDDQYPIKKGAYEVILDYPHDAKSETGEGYLNHLYVYDREHDRVVARYVSNGGKFGATKGKDLEIDAVIVRPTWQPTASELKENADFAADGPGPTGSMGLVKLHLTGAEYIHGVEDADLETDEQGRQHVLEDPSAMNDLGKPGSHGCWNMSNPNVVELVEKFGVGATFDADGTPHLTHTKVHILGNSAADRATAKHLDDLTVQEHLGDRMPSDGTDILEQDYQTTRRYLRDHSYYDTRGVAQPADKWYVELWKKRRDGEKL